jgi:peptidoglycan hydrolase-like protein with peptidoglycan-binding domain
MKSLNVLKLAVSASAIMTILFAVPAMGSAASRLGPDSSRAGEGFSASQIHRAAYDADVYQVQEALNDLGYEAGPEDGRFGRQTASAIRAFQRDHGLAVTGEISPPLVRRLEAAQEAQSARRQSAAAEPRLERTERSAVAERGSVTADVIAAIQSGLRRQGYAVPVISGEMNPATEDAIRVYQRDHDLLVDGRASRELLAHVQQTGEQVQPGSDRDVVRAVQQALNARGYDAGPADGILGESTRDAIRTFESDADLELTGRVRPELLSALGIAAAAVPEAEEAKAPEYRTVLSDDFADGNYTSSPRWQVLAGEFGVVDGVLISEIDVEPMNAQQLGQEMIKGIVGDVLGMPIGGAGDLAAIKSTVGIGDAFRIDARIAGSGESAVFGLGPYSGFDASQGYRLEYKANTARPLRLIVVSEGETAVIASSDPAIDLADGGMHEVVWQRDQDGQMTVFIDDTQVLEARDNTYDQGFSGLSLLNGGGLWKVDRVTVRTSG